MAKFSCLPTLSVVKKKKSKAFSKDADDNKKGSSKGDLRVKPIDRFSSSSENGLKEQFLPVSNSVPSVDKGTSVIPKVLSDVSLARTEFTGDAAYEGGDEHDEIQSMKREYSDFDLQSKELASHGSNADFSSYVFEKTDLTAPNQKGGYSSDAQEPGNKLDDKWKKVTDTETDWVTLSSISSHVDRVNVWVNSLDDSLFIPVNSEEDCDEMEDEETADLNRLESKDSSDRACSNSNRRVAEEVTQANIIIQSLNTLSTVAHIPGLALKVIPSISAFACLRSVNLSGNCIVTITPGSLPKSLHTLDLSRNKISTMEGLKDLERLRVLNISYNRIAKIGHGLSSCTLIKELYLAGNKISNVEGLHRLLKLTVLDLSFNKIITAKGLGQLVANYNSLLAVNLVGNPILASIGDDQLRKAVLSLLPHVTYLNKQPIKPLKVREVVSEKVTKAALGDAGGSSKRKLTKRLSQSSGSFAKSKVAETTKHGKGKRSTSTKYAQ